MTNLQNRIPVAVLGATSMVGQRFTESANASPHRVASSKESSESLCNDPRRLNSKPVAILRKMFYVCTPKLFCILWCNKGIFVSPEHKGRDMSRQVMETVFLLNEILRIDAAVQLHHHATGLRFREREGIGLTDILWTHEWSNLSHHLLLGRKGHRCHG